VIGDKAENTTNYDKIWDTYKWQTYNFTSSRWLSL